MGSDRRVLRREEGLHELDACVSSGATARAGCGWGSLAGSDPDPASGTACIGHGVPPLTLRESPTTGERPTMCFFSLLDAKPPCTRRHDSVARVFPNSVEGPRESSK